MTWSAGNSAGESAQKPAAGLWVDGWNLQKHALILREPANRIRRLCARVRGKPADWTLLILRSGARTGARRAPRSGNALSASCVKFQYDVGVEEKCKVATSVGTLLFGRRNLKWNILMESWDIQSLKLSEHFHLLHSAGRTQADLAPSGL